VKSFEIDKRLVYQAWEKVRANNGAPGVDAVSVSLFEERWRNNLCAHGPGSMAEPLPEIPPGQLRWQPADLSSAT
jgi:hypothetical protein